PRPATLNTDRDELAEAAQPCQQAPVPVAGRSKRRRVQDPTEVIDHRGDMDVLVGIDPAEDPAFTRGLRDRGHATPSINQDWMARTAGRADRTVIGPSCTGASSVTFAQPVRATCRASLTRPTGHIQGTNNGQPICGSDRVSATLHAP